MATILLVEDEPDLALHEARLLRQRGHRVLRCDAEPSGYGTCLMMDSGACPLPDEADLILLSCRLFAPVTRDGARGRDLLGAYRSHPRYGRLPMLVVAAGRVDVREGSGPVAFVDKFSPPSRILDAVRRLLEPAATTGTGRG